MNTLARVFLGLVIVTAVSGFGFQYLIRAGEAAGPRQAYSTEACRMAYGFVEERLHAPATAQFPRCSGSDETLAYLRDDVWKVSGYVDAQNGFGALVRSDFWIEIHYDSDTKVWTLLDFMLAPR